MQSLEPTKEEFYRRLLEKEYFKDKQKLRAGEKPLTLIVGVKCKDGILMQSDTQVINLSTLSAKEVAKMYPIPESEGAPYILAIAGKYALFSDIVEIFKKEFVGGKSNKPKRLTKVQCKKLVNKCRNLIIRELVFDNLNEQGIPLAYFDRFYPKVGIIFAAKVILPNGKEDLVLYSFSIEDEATEEDFTYNGSVNDAMHLFYKIGKHSLQRMGKDWNLLSMKFLAQLLTFPFRYIPDLDKSVGKPYTSYKLTISEGCKQFSAVQYFAKSYEKKKKDLSYELDFIPELLETGIKEVGIASILKFLKVASFDEAKRKYFLGF